LTCGITAAPKTTAIAPAAARVWVAIARRAVELHKGTIRARNTDPGLRVEIALP
jgi:hypothetical protein